MRAEDGGCELYMTAPLGLDLQNFIIQRSGDMGI